MITLDESFENPALAPGGLTTLTPANWVNVSGITFRVDSRNSSYFFGNHDGVIDSQFLALGNNLNRGNIYYTISTTPGMEYQISYNYAFSDGFRFGVSPPVTSSFKSLIVAYYGMVEVVDHNGNVTMMENTQQIAGATHSKDLPGVRDYEVGNWTQHSYNFIATSMDTRIFLTQGNTTAFTAVGVVDKVVIQSIPESCGVAFACVMAVLMVIRRKRK